MRRESANHTLRLVQETHGSPPSQTRGDKNCSVPRLSGKTFFRSATMKLFLLIILVGRLSSTADVWGQTSYNPAPHCVPLYVFFVETNQLDFCVQVTGTNTYTVQVSEDLLTWTNRYAPFTNVPQLQIGFKTEGTRFYRVIEE